jgi:hypothetical protein
MATLPISVSPLLGALKENPNLTEGNIRGKNLLANVNLGITTTTASPPVEPPANSSGVASPSTQSPNGKWSKEQLAEINAALTAAKSGDEQRAILAKVAQGDQNKWLALIALLVPVMLNNWKVDANQVNWWKEAVPAMSGVLT